METPRMSLSPEMEKMCPENVAEMSCMETAGLKTPHTYRGNEFTPYTYRGNTKENT